MILIVRREQIRAARPKNCSARFFYWHDLTGSHKIKTAGEETPVSLNGEFYSANQCRFSFG